MWKISRLKKKVQFWEATLFVSNGYNQQSPLDFCVRCGNYNSIRRHVLTEVSGHTLTYVCIHNTYHFTSVNLDLVMMKQ